jgi:hypothetical protein
MTAPGPRERSPALLDAHPELRALMDRSEALRLLEERERVEIDGITRYIVRGDTLGSREELFVDALSRGSSSEGADPLSRALFLELPPALQDVIRRATRLDPEGQPGKAPGGPGPGG